MFDQILTDRETQWRLLRFLLVGAGTALVQVAVLRALKTRCGETLAFSLSWVVSTTTHYFANRFWALPSGRADTTQQFGEYLFAVAVSYLINLGVFKLLPPSYLAWASHVKARKAYYRAFRDVPAYRNLNNGFRLARTLLPIPLTTLPINE